MLKIEDLSVRIGGFRLEHIHLHLKEGEVLGIVGESGSGKTLLSYLILQLVKDYKVESGRIEFLGTSILDAKEATMQHLRGKEVGYIFQEPLSALNPLHTVKKQLSEALLIHQNLTRTTLQHRILELLEYVQLPKHCLESYPHTLSGGQRQRVCIAIALANNPKLLIADEPTTALDSTTQAQIIALLKALQRKLNLSVLLISHNLSVVSKLCENIIVLREGRILESGTTKSIFTNPKNAYTQMLLNALKFSYNAESYSKEVVLEARHLSVAYPIKKSFFGKTLESYLALKPLSFTLHKGESLGIVGESGSGKSSLANAICRLLESNSVKGEVRFLQKDFFAIKGKELLEFRAKIQMIFQDPFSALNPKMSIFTILKEGLEAHPKLKEANLKAQIIRTLEDVGLSEEFLWRYPNELSGGQRQRISIARSLILRPKVLILDEPTSALDCAMQSQILTLLLKLAKEYSLSYLCISHDLSVIATLCQNVLVLKNGDVLESGVIKDVFNAPKHPYVKGLLRSSTLGS